MVLSAVIIFSLVLGSVKDGYAYDRLIEFARRLRAVEDSRFTLLDKIKELEWSLKDELAGMTAPPLINRQLKQANTDLPKVGNTISAHVLEEIHSLKSNVQNIKTQFKALSQKLRNVEQERNMYREDLGKVRDELVTTRKEVQSCRKDLEEMQRTLPADIDRINTELHRTTLNLSSTRRVMDGLTQDLTKLTTCCVVRNETVPGTATASTDASQDPSLRTTVPPVTGTTQDSDQHATPSPATGRRLYDASRDGDLETVRRIVAAGHVDINYRGSRSRTPVMMAARKGHRDVVEFLVDEGADPSLVDKDGNNVLHLACWGGDLETVKLIVSLNLADINSRGRWSMTPVMLAALFGHRDVVEFLVGEGADLSLVDSRGDNILHYACDGGHLETVKLILSLNVPDINARNNNGLTAADVARGRRRQRVVDLLVSRGGV